jgi:hypothetical protein
LDGNCRIERSEDSVVGKVGLEITSLSISFWSTPVLFVKIKYPLIRTDVTLNNFKKGSFSLGSVFDLVITS